MITVKISEEDIRNTIEEATCSSESILNLYKIVYPDFDIRLRFSYPKANSYTINKIIHFLQSTWPLERQDILLNWLNKGFGTDEELANWEFSRDA